MLAQTLEVPMSQLTREFVSADLPVRLAARVIDILLLSAAGGALGWGIGFGFGWLTATAGIVLAYFVVGDVIAGTTLGKAVLHLRVTGPGGGRIAAKQALIRECFMVFGAIPFAGPPLALITWVWIIVTIRKSPLRQGKHDELAGGTRVIVVRPR